MLTEPYTDYLFPKYVRHLLLMVGGLIFYAQYTIFLLGPVVFNGAPGTPVFSAWTALAYLEWTSPADIRIPQLHLQYRSCTCFARFFPLAQEASSFSSRRPRVGDSFGG